MNAASAAVVAVVEWVCLGMPLAMAAALAAYAVGVRCGRARGERERARLARRVETFTTILRPVAAAARVGRLRFWLPPRDLAVLSVLVEEPGEDGEALAALEEMFHPPPH
ncbi:hypothetical protein [Planomonospora algeriensis]